MPHARWVLVMRARSVAETNAIMRCSRARSKDKLMQTHTLPGSTSRANSANSPMDMTQTNDADDKLSTDTAHTVSQHVRAD